MSLLRALIGWPLAIIGLLLLSIGIRIYPKLENRLAELLSSSNTEN